MPIASSSRVSRTSVVSGSASAILIKWASHVSGKAETIFTPDRFRALYTILEFSTETGTAADCSTGTIQLWRPIQTSVNRNRLTVDERCALRCEKHDGVRDLPQLTD